MAVGSGGGTAPAVPGSFLVRVAVWFPSLLPSVRARSPMSDTMRIPRLLESGAFVAVDGAETDLDPLDGSTRLLGRDGPDVGEDADERSAACAWRIRAVDDRGSWEGELGIGRRDELGELGNADRVGEAVARGMYGVGDWPGFGDEMDANDESANEWSPGITRSDSDSSWDDSRTGDMR